MQLRRILMTMALLAAAFFAALPETLNARDRDDLQRDEVRRAVESGEIRSLADILTAVRRKLPGEVAGVEVEKKAGRWLYEFRVVDGQGRMFDVYVNAQNAEIERVKEK